MAIFISTQKIRAQSKGAMTNMPLANLTFTESLFYLEDTMKKEGCSKNNANYSRAKARKLFKETYHINLPRNIVVHHEDHNPFNNNKNNLRAMLRNLHTSHHAKKAVKWGSPRTINTLEYLDKLLIIYNDSIF